MGEIHIKKGGVNMGDHLVFSINMRHFLHDQPAHGPTEQRTDIMDNRMSFAGASKGNINLYTFLGSMLPKYMAFSVCVSKKCQKLFKSLKIP